MSLYYYKKYNADSNTGYENYQEGTLIYQGVTNEPAQNTGYTLGSFYDTTPFLTYYYSGEITETVNSSNQSSLLATSYTNTTRNVMYMLYIQDGLSGVQVYTRQDTCDSYTYYTRGSYIETLVAEDGTYPDDGKSGSYWYVKDQLYVQPEVITVAVSNLSYDSVQLNGNLTEQGLESNLTRGFQWGEIVSDNNVSAGAGNEGTFNVAVETLDPNTEYLYRAYVTNSYETVYGDTLSFTTLEQPLKKPTINSPENDTDTTERSPVFDFNLTDEPINTATKYHARLRISLSLDLGLAEHLYESKEGTGTWEYYNTGTSSWESFPSAGVDPGTRVRCTISDQLDYRQLYYWDCASYDGADYGFDTTPRGFRVVLNIEGLFTLVIAGNTWLARNLSVTEAANGEIGEISFEVTNQDGYGNENINYGDTVILGAYDAYGNSKEFEGVVDAKYPTNIGTGIIATLGDGVFGQRLLNEDYILQDVGLTLKSAVDTYCSPVTTVNVDTSLGFSSPYPGINKTVLRMFEDLRRRYGFLFYVDRDWDLHVYLKNSISLATVGVKYGE